MKRYSLIICLIFISACTTLFAADKPSWTSDYYEDLTNSYIKSVSGTGGTREEARNNALKQLASDRSYETGIRTNVKIDSNGNVLVTGSDDLTVKARVINEWSELLPNSMTRVYVLAQVAKNPAIPFEQVDVTNKYPFTPAVFVPGMAQFKKGSTGKGVLFISTIAAGIGTIVATECMRADYASKINTTHDAMIKQSYIDKANNWQNGRNIAIAATAALYAWNVIDGIVAKGRTHVVVNKGRSLTFAPFWSPDGSGVSLAFNF